MNEIKEKLLRPCRVITDNIIIAIFFSLLLMTAGVMLSGPLIRFTGIKNWAADYFQSDNLTAFFIDYLEFIGLWIAILLGAIIPKKNRPMLRSFLPNRRGNNLKGIIAGILLGFGANGFCVLMSVLKGDIKLSYSGIEPGILLLFIVVVFIQSGAEELVDRFYLYQKLRRRYRSPLIAIIVNSAVFMALHILNPGFTAIAGSQIFLVGIIFSLFVYYYDSLWAAMWFHAAWNYTQNIIFGLPNSGIVSEYSIFRLEAASATSGLFYDVKFGVEGSIGASLVLIILIIILVLINRYNPECHDCWAEAEAAASAKAAFSAKEETAESITDTPAYKDSDYRPKH